MSDFWEREITHEAAAMLEHLPKDIALTGADVGVLRAKTSCIMMHRLPMLRLVLVDNWREESEGPTGEAVYREALGNLASFEGRFKIVHGDSTMGADAVDDDALDYVLIDADHTYPKCLIDMLAWWPKLREFGVMFHHDVDHPDFPHWGVRRAVSEFCEINNVEYNVNTELRMAVIHKPPMAMGRKC